MFLLSKREVFANSGIKPRKRVLDEDEVWALVRATAKLKHPWCHLYKWLLLTGCRLSDATDAQWAEFKPELRKAIRDAKASGQSVDWAAVPDSHKLWQIPAERFKSDVPQILPLSDGLCEILELVPMRGKFVFSYTGDNALWLSDIRTCETDLAA